MTSRKRTRFETNKVTEITDDDDLMHDSSINKKLEIETKAAFHLNNVSLDIENPTRF